MYGESREVRVLPLRSPPSPIGWNRFRSPDGSPGIDRVGETQPEDESLHHPLTWHTAVDDQFANVKSAHFKVIDRQSAHTPASHNERPNRETTDRERPDRGRPESDRTEGNGAKTERAIVGYG